jgi:hypothetical protein
MFYILNSTFYILPRTARIRAKLNHCLTGNAEQVYIYSRTAKEETTWTSA